VPVDQLREQARLPETPLGPDDEVAGSGPPCKLRKRVELTLAIDESLYVEVEQARRLRPVIETRIRRPLIEVDVADRDRPSRADVLEDDRRTARRACPAVRR
jgi:hypothetical protein